MSAEIIPMSGRPSAPAVGASALPVLVERAGPAGRFAWEEFFHAEPHNPHAQRAYLRAVKGFLSRCGGQLPSITPGMVGQYLVGLGGPAAERNLHLSALRGFFDRPVDRHVVILNPASVKGVKDRVIEGKTPEMAVEQARTLLASIRLGETVKDDLGQEIEKPLVIGLRDLAILATLRFTACRAGAVAKLRMGDFQREGGQYVLRFQEKGGKSREIPVRHDLEGMILAYIEAAAIGDHSKDSPLFTAVLNRMAYVSSSGRLGRDPAIGQSWVSTQPTRNSPEALSNATRLRTAVRRARMARRRRLPASRSPTSVFASRSSGG